MYCHHIPCFLITIFKISGLLPLCICRKTIWPDSIDLLFRAYTFKKSETKNNFKKIEMFSQIIVFSCKCLPLFPFIFIFIPLNPFKCAWERSEKQQTNSVWPNNSRIKFDYSTQNLAQNCNNTV